MIDKTIGHYKIVERVGRGAMGEVYRAKDMRLGRSVALKFLADDRVDDRARKRLLREAQAVSRLDHPNICMVYEIDEAPDGRLYIVMGYYEGESLKQRTLQGRPSVVETVEMAIDVANGLDYAHGRGVVHRDLKPANLIIEKSGNIRIVDFGLAKLADFTSMTDAGMTVGTIAYMSPEQATGGKVDGRSDIFSLGIVMYELLAGFSPFHAEESAAILFRLLHEEPRPLSESQSGIPAKLNDIVMRSLAKDPEQRYQSAGELRDDLLALLDDLDPARASRWRRLNARVRASRRLRRVFTAAFRGVVLLAVVVLLLTQPGDTGTRTIESSGIAVLAFSADEPYGATACGLEEDVLVRLLEASGSQDGMWVIPEGRARLAGVTAVEDAAGKLGVGRVVTGSCRENGGQLEIALNLVEAATGEIRRAETVAIDGVNSNWQDPLAPALARLLGLPQDPGRVHGAAIGPRTPAAYRSYVTALGLERSQDGLEGAMNAYLRAIVEDSTFALAHARLGLLLVRMPSVNDSVRTLALAHLRTAVRLAPDVSYVHSALGRTLVSMGAYDAGLEQLEAAARLNPADPVIHRVCARAYQAMQRTTDEERAYRDEIDACPQFWGGYEDLGYFYYSQGRLEEAITQFLTVRGLAPDYAPTYNYLGALYQALDRWEESLENYEKSFSLGKSYFACANLGTHYYFLHRFEDAAAMYELALEYDSSDYTVVGSLGDAYYWIPGKRPRALELVHQALAMAEGSLQESPDDPLLHVLIAGYQATLGLSPDDARASVERALELAPDDAEINYRACIAYEIMGRRAKALALLGRAVDLGFSLNTIKNEPWLDDLREDSRYPLLLDEEDS
jgi:tetratricopeptide (TPR) repeat protein/tRNA A-37 threonylcarbamoyl transferase component Bud32